MSYHLDYILFFYGFGFILLSIACFFQRGSKKYDLPWNWLGLFGLLHGLNQWLDLLSLDLIGSGTWGGVHVCVGVVSLFCLVEFSRLATRKMTGKGPGRWVTFLLFGLGCSRALFSETAAGLTFRYSLALTAGIWASLVFLLASRRATSAGERRHCMAIGVLFAIYCVVSGLIIPRGPHLPASLPNQEAFLSVFGFPVQLLRGCLAVAIAVAVWHLLQSRKVRWVPLHTSAFVVSVLMVLATGWIFTEHVSAAVHRDCLGDFTALGRLSALSVNKDLVKVLGSYHVTQSDRDSARSQFMRIAEECPHIDRMYLLAPKNGQIIYQVDSGLNGTKQRHLLGTAYEGCREAMSLILSGKSCGLTLEHADDWGTWISTFVPVRDQSNQKVIAVFGIDRSSAPLASLIGIRRLEPIAMTLLALMLLTLFCMAYDRQKSALELISASEKALRESDERFEKIAEQTTEMIWEVNAEGLYTYVSQVSRALTGYEPEDLVNKKHFYDIHPVQGRESFKEAALQAFARKDSFHDLENMIETRDGSVIWVSTNGIPILSTDGTLLGYRGSDTDITARKRAESQIKLQAAAINAAGDLIAILDRDARIVFANDSFQRETGCEPDEFLGQHLSEFWPKTADGRSPDDLWESINQGRSWSGDMLCRSKHIICTVDVAITPLYDADGSVQRLIAIARNITEKKIYEDLLDYQAHHDALTDLPNRLSFSEELAQTVGHSASDKSQCAVLFVDLDRFKLVNDTMGHPAGDDILVEVANRLHSCLGEKDILARMGGDEFTVLLRQLGSSEEAATVAERMLRKISLPFTVGNSKLVISASIGMSVYPENAADVDGLLKSADAAMYRAKELGRNNYQFYSDQIRLNNLARVETENDLRAAIVRDELKTYYQPIVDVGTNRLVGAEALLRWNHPEKGMVSPDLFIPVAEETGLILEIGNMVLETACRECKHWHDLGFRDLDVSVNVSPIQLRNDRFISEVLTVLSDTGLDPQYLILEITETVVVKNDFGEVRTLARLKAFGIRTSLDDFGIGYSSLSRLKDLPIAHMKVDGTFIRDIENNPKDRAMTESIIRMAHNLGIRVTAEWIESSEQMFTVGVLGCDYAQGYLISPALPADEFHSFIGEWSSSAELEAA